MGAEEDDPVQRRLRDARAWLISATLAEVRRCAEQASDLSAMGTARNARPSAPGNRSGLTMEGRGGSLAW